jgi:hypothetical protein
MALHNLPKCFRLALPRELGKVRIGKGGEIGRSDGDRSGHFRLLVAH